MAALDLLGRRWVLRILWELHREPAGFRELQRRCDHMSSSVLATRLGELIDVDLVDTSAGGYRLTAVGADLVEALQPLLSWSDRWARQLSPDPDN